MDYTLIRSRRKTMALQVTRDLGVVVRAPFSISKKQIDAFVLKHERWIKKHLEKQQSRPDRLAGLTSWDIEELRAKAKGYIPGRVAYYSEKMGLCPAGVKITSAKTRFGSCSGKNNLCFSLYLMLYPESAIDYVVVHELSHIQHKNHGKEFYGCIEKIMPDYKKRRQLLHY